MQVASIVICKRSLICSNIFGGYMKSFLLFAFACAVKSALSFAFTGLNEDYDFLLSCKQEKITPNATYFNVTGDTYLWVDLGTRSTSVIPIVDGVQVSQGSSVVGGGLRTAMERMKQYMEVNKVGMNIRSRRSYAFACLQTRFLRQAFLDHAYVSKDIEKEIYNATFGEKLNLPVYSFKVLYPNKKYPVTLKEDRKCFLGFLCMAFTRKIRSFKHTIQTDSEIVTSLAILRKHDLRLAEIAPKHPDYQFLVKDHSKILLKLDNYVQQSYSQKLIVSGSNQAYKYEFYTGHHGANCELGPERFLSLENYFDKDSDPLPSQIFMAVMHTPMEVQEKLFNNVRVTAQEEWIVPKGFKARLEYELNSMPHLTGLTAQVVDGIYFRSQHWSIKTRQGRNPKRGLCADSTIDKNVV
jgi:hypothetical protein